MKSRGDMIVLGNISIHMVYKMIFHILFLSINFFILSRKLSFVGGIDMMYTLIIADLLNYSTVALEYLVNTSKEKIYKHFDNKQGLTYLIQQSRCLQL